MRSPAAVERSARDGVGACPTHARGWSSRGASRRSTRRGGGGGAGVFDAGGGGCAGKGAGGRRGSWDAHADGGRRGESRRVRGAGRQACNERDRACGWGGVGVQRRCCQSGAGPGARAQHSALTLRELGGLTTEAIAKRVSQPSRRRWRSGIVRAKRIREAGIPYEVPSWPICARLDAVLQRRLTLVFQRGYLASSGAT